MRGFPLLAACLLILSFSAGYGQVVEETPADGVEAGPSAEAPGPNPAVAGIWNIHQADGFLSGLTPFCCGVFVTDPVPALIAGTPVTGLVWIDPGVGGFKPFKSAEGVSTPVARGLFTQGESIAVLFLGEDVMGLVDPGEKVWHPRSAWFQTGSQAGAADEEQGTLWVALQEKLLQYESGRLIRHWPYPQGLPLLQPRALAAAGISVWLVLESRSDQPLWWLAQATVNGFEAIHQLGPVNPEASIVLGTVSERYLWLAFGSPDEAGSKLFAWEIATAVLVDVDVSSLTVPGKGNTLLVTALEAVGETVWVGTAGAGAFLCRPVSPKEKPGGLALEVVAASPSPLAEKIIYDFVPAPQSMWILSTGLVAEYKE